MHIPSLVVALPVVMILASQSAVADSADAFGFPDWARAKSIEEQRTALYSMHLECESEAVSRVLSQGEVIACAEVFLRLKLSFLPGSDAARFAALSAPTRAEANRKGYAAYRSWLHRKLTLAPSIHEDRPKVLK